MGVVATGVVAIVQVWNDDGDVLHVWRDDDWQLPRQRGVGSSAFYDVVERGVRADLAVDCDADGIGRVAIAGVRERDGDAETVSRLLAVVDANHVTGTPSEGRWRGIDSPVAGGDG